MFLVFGKIYFPVNVVNIPYAMSVWDRIYDSPSPSWSTFYDVLIMIKIRRYISWGLYMSGGYINSLFFTQTHQKA